MSYHTWMLDRSACERRVYRLATLLTGDPAVAAGVVSGILAVHADLRRIDSMLLDRLVVLRSREAGSWAGSDLQIPGHWPATLGALDMQSREAWILRRVYGTGQRDCARAMDCSTTALARHLDRATSSLESGCDPGDMANGITAIRAYLRGLDLPLFLQRRIMVRRRSRAAGRVMRALALLSLFLGLLALAWQQGWFPSLLSGGQA